MEPFIGQIQIFGFNFAPEGWAFCNGQEIAISENQALFSLLGTRYGGNGRTTFGLPDLRGRTATHFGDGPGLSPIQLGQQYGYSQVNLQQAHMPTHNHNTTSSYSAKVKTSAPVSPTNSSGDGIAGLISGGDLSIYEEDPNLAESLPDSTVQVGGEVTLATTGASQAVEIMQPFLGLYHCISLFGTFPSRN